MAKSKKKKAQLGLILTVLIIVVAVLGAALFLFLNVVTLKEVDLENGGLLEDIQSWISKNTAFTGMQVVFGCTGVITILIKDIEIEILNFSFVALIPLILLFAGIILNIFNSKLLGLVGAVCFVGAAIMFVLTPNFISFAGSDSLGASDIYQAAIGSYLAMACAGLCALLSIGRTLKI